MQNFLPWHGLAGGLMIGLSAAFFLLASGRMSGISGILENTLKPQHPNFAWSLSYLLGLPAGAVLINFIAPQLVPKIAISGAWPIVVIAGVLVGFGTRLGSGCTSGHGVCGLPRFSARSFAATGIFMAVAALTVFAVRHVL